MESLGLSESQTSNSTFMFFLFSKHDNWMQFICLMSCEYTLFSQIYEKKKDVMLKWFLFIVCLVGPPGFLQEPEAEQIVSIGDFAYFTCVGSGAPPFNITWSKEGDMVCVFSSFFIIIIFFCLKNSPGCLSLRPAERVQQHECEHNSMSTYEYKYNCP